MQGVQAKTQSKKTRAKVLLVINADTSKRIEVPTDRSKERLADFSVLKSALAADVLDWNDINSYLWSRLLAKAGGKGVALATLAFLRRKYYQAFYCDSENNGLVLALLFKVSRTQKPLLTIGHWVTPSKKAVLFKRLALYSHIHTLFLHSSTQYQKVITELGFPKEKVKLVPYQVDTKFWSSQYATPPSPTVTQKPYICTAGLEFRDYATLIEAVRDLPIDVKIGAASYWSKRKSGLTNEILPPNVEVRSYNYQELRDLYAGCLFVVVPLYDTDFQAGITLILEALSMGKAIIVSRSEGQGDTIVDRRKTLRDSTVDTSGKFLQMYGNDTLKDALGANGFYVKPGDASELRRSIQYLLDNPEVAQKMGERGREYVENTMSVELFGERISKAVLESMKLPAPPDSEIITETKTDDKEISKV